MKNKTKKMLRILITILLVIVIQMMGITYAKYITSERATGQAEVAQWAFQIRKAGEETKTIKLLNTAVTDSLVEGKIAPGTVGKIDLILDATGSEVDMEYTVEFYNEQNKPANLTFNYLGTEYKSLAEIGELTGEISHGDKNRTDSIEISWLWPYETGSTAKEKEENNRIDTENASTDYTFDVIVTAMQSK